MAYRPTSQEDEKGAFRFSPRPNRADEIRWRKWGEVAFRDAQREGKLVLLSISAVWCHWCHVMDETTYSDTRVIERINRDYIPVRVDSDRRPDINRRYNQGGWPTTAFLLPSGRAVAGLTYAPPEQLLALLERLAVVYRGRRQEIEVEAAAAVAGERKILQSFAGDEVPDAADWERETILSSWDREHGGLDGAPKFPPFDALEFALSKTSETGDPALRDFALSTLDGMSEGGLRDDVEGGFFRYATAADWSTPHFEKMLADNARLASLFLWASDILDRTDYLQIARSTIDYTLSTLLEDGRLGFFGSQDADEQYYSLGASERAEVEPPAVDRTVYTDSTSMMLSTLVRASACLSDPDLLSIAAQIADRLWTAAFTPGTGMAHYQDLLRDETGLEGQPADQVYYLAALSDLFQATQDETYLERAVELADIVLELYLSGMGWIGEAATSRQDAVRGARTGSLEDMPVDMPDIAVNAAGARVLMALELMADDNGYGKAAEDILRSLSERYRSFGTFSAGYVLAACIFREGHIELRVSTGSDNGLTEGITRAAVGTYNPRLVTRPETVEDYLQVTGGDTSPAAVACSPGRCVPVDSAASLKGALLSLTRGLEEDGDGPID